MYRVPTICQACTQYMEVNQMKSLSLLWGFLASLSKGSFLFTSSRNKETK